MVRIALASLAIVVAWSAAVAAGQGRPYVGRPVAEVLQELQAGGLRIVFSTDLVPPALRVRAEEVLGR